MAGNSAWSDIANEWHPTIARAIIESWGVSEEVGIAAEQQNILTDDAKKPEDHLSMLSRILSASKLYNSLSAPAHENLDAAEIEGVLKQTSIGGIAFMDLAAQSREDIDKVGLSISL